MTLTKFILAEANKSIADDIFNKAIDMVADDSELNGSRSFHSDDVLRAAEVLAKNNKHKTAIIELIKIRLKLEHGNK